MDAPKGSIRTAEKEKNDLHFGPDPKVLQQDILTSSGLPETLGFRCPDLRFFLCVFLLNKAPGNPECFSSLVLERFFSDSRKLWASEPGPKICLADKKAEWKKNWLKIGHFFWQWKRFRWHFANYFLQCNYASSKEGKINLDEVNLQVW